MTTTAEAAVTTPPSAVRRSGRARRPAASVYEDAKKALSASKTDSGTKKGGRPGASQKKGGGTPRSSRQPSKEPAAKRARIANGADAEDSASEDEEDEEENEEMKSEEEDSDSDSSSNDGEDFRPGNTPVISAARARARAKAKAEAETESAKAAAPKRKLARPRGVHAGLAALSRKVLEEGESPSTSLVAGLLQAHRSNVRGAASSLLPSHPPSPHTAGLEALARGIVETHNADPNKAQISLLNLLFRSVGGTVATNLDAEADVLEDMDNERWTSVVTDLVDEMRHTPADRVLLCADPEGAVHAAAGEGGADAATATTNNPTPPSHHNASSLAIREYRRIYQEFWFVLASCALTHGALSTAGSTVVPSEDNAEDNDSETGDDEDHDKATAKRKRGRKASAEVSLSTTNSHAVSRFDAELVRDLAMRIIELASVGQPDVRAAASLALFQMGHAVLQRTVALQAKLDSATRQLAAASGGAKRSNSAKAEVLRHTVDSLQRNCNDLEHVVLGPIIQGVFIHRYRDSNRHVRAACLQALSQMTLQRPDLFLVDKYLKYFGWMMSDKAEGVRVASLAALSAPFKAVHGADTRGDAVSPVAASKIDLGRMANLVAKFLPRITECILDVSVRVQEESMCLFLHLLRDGFLDDIDDDSVWNRVNLRAIAPDTSATVRRLALYFILEQLEAFDDGDDGYSIETPRRSTEGPASVSSESSERRAANRVDALASWIAHALTDGPVQLEDIRVDLVDLVVQSLRQMPEHESLTRHWSALVRTIKDDRAATSMDGMTSGQRADVAKQRVLVEMLVCAARAEVASVADHDFLLETVDVDILRSAPSSHWSAATAAAIAEKDGALKRRPSKASSKELQHENLSASLLRALPGLLLKFKGDAAVLSRVCELAQYLLPSVFGLPQRKNDYAQLTKNLVNIFLHSSDEEVLNVVAASISHLSRGDHARAPEARLLMQNLTSDLRKRVSAAVEKLPDLSQTDDSKESVRRSSRLSLESSQSSSQEDDNGREIGLSFYWDLLRLRVLSKRCDLAVYLPSEKEEHSTDGLFGVVADGIETQLRSPEAEEESADGEDASHRRRVVLPRPIAARCVNEGLSFLLATLAWRVVAMVAAEELANESDDESTTEREEGSDYGIQQLRKRLVGIVERCFEQYSATAQDGPRSPQIAFADSVQVAAGRVASDLRMLFPKEWENAASPVLRKLALTDEGRLIGGYVRFFRSREQLLRSEKESNSNKELVDMLLLPMARSLTVNWKSGNRREAGVALSHVTGSGPQAAELSSTMARVLKRIDPVRLLEAHMASLRQSYEDWLDNEPEELESDRPSDAEMAEFENRERIHKEQFQNLERLAGRFSSSLGVGKLDAKLSPALLGFVKEGIRYAFSGDEKRSDELVLGSRLSFLSLITKYIVWVRRSNNHIQIIRDELERKENEIRNDPEFDDVHEDDLGALSLFRFSLGLAETAPSPATKSTGAVCQTVNDDIDDDDERKTAGGSDDEDGLGDLTMTPAASSITPGGSSRRRGFGSSARSKGSSVSSVRSRVSSVRSSLSPLYEDDDEDTNEQSVARQAGRLATASTVSDDSGLRTRNTEESSAAGATPDGAGAVSVADDASMQEDASTQISTLSAGDSRLESIPGDASAATGGTKRQREEEEAEEEESSESPSSQPEEVKKARLRR